MTGTTVSHYQILERLGGGGMGVVYKARDLKLGRLVALKFLSSQRGSPEEEKRRFLREAQAASQLDHPNICTIYEIDEAGDGTLFIAMALYEGETLRQRLDRGPLPLAQAVDVALQVAAGLAQAHEKGIIHRDVKPANIFLTSALMVEGRVKLLDFGIARLTDQSRLTRAGMAVGTAAYMPPEQFRGQPADRRSDIWGLGVVIYEMVTGRVPFQGASNLEVVREILQSDPAPMSQLRSGVPERLERIVAMALSKPPAGRYASMEALRADLLPLAAPSTPREVRPETPPPLVKRGFGVLAVLVAIAVIAAIAAVAAGVAWFGLPRSAVHAGEGPAPATFTKLTDQKGSETFPSISPSGGEFVYVKATAPGNLDVYSQRIGGSNSRNLTEDSPVADTQPAFSPGGETIAFRSERDGGGIFLMGATGESVRRLTNFGFNPAWSPDGKEILVATEAVSDPRVRRTTSEIWRVDVALGTGNRRLAVPGDAVQPSWSPHGWRIAYWGLPAGSARRVIWTVSARGGEAVPVVDDEFLNWSPVWSPDGRYLYLSSNRSGSMNLWRVPIDEASGRVLGPLEPVTVSSEWSGLLSLSKDGRKILYATNENKTNLARISLDPGTLRPVGRLEPVTEGSRGIRSCEVSPDGQWLAFHATLPQEDLFVIRTDGTGLRQLTNDPFRDRYPRWSPNGERLLFQSNRSGRNEVWALRVDGSSLTPLTRTTGQPPTNPLWSPDGREVACSITGRGTVLLDLSRGLDQRQPVSLPAVTRGQLFYASSWSPDGRWLAGLAERQDAQPSPGLFLYSLASRSYSRLTDRGEGPRWLRNSRILLFRDEGRILAVDVATRKIREVIAPPPSSAFTAHSMAPDGRTLYAALTEEEGDVCMLTLKQLSGGL